MATCPECEYDEIDTADYEEGDIFSCPECGKNLVVLGGDDVDLADEDDDLDDDLDDDEEEEEEDDDDDDIDVDDLDEDEDDEDEDFDE